MIKNYLAVALGALLMAWLAYSSGLIVGAKRQKALDSAQYLQDLTKAMTENEKKVAEIENNFSKKLELEISNYEKAKSEIENVYSQQLNDFSGLRAKPCDANLPKASDSGAARRSNDTPKTSRGGEPGEIDFAGVAQQVVELGRELDEQNQKLIFLQEYAKSCKNAIRL